MLGEFCLTYNGVRVTALSSSRLRTLLAYLILHRGAPQPRQPLAFLLWPDSTEAQARTNLRNLVHLLCQALPHGDCCLRRQGQILLWEPHVPYALDVAEFEAAVKAGALQTAVELYRGDLVPECYGDWVAPERERLRQLYITALERLVQQTEDARDHRASLGYALRLVREDPLCEEHSRRLIRLQMLAGDRAAALRTYHTCATALSRELGVEPALATRQVYTLALHGAASIAQPSPGLPEGTLPLVGRRLEWDQLLKTWQSAASGHPQLALVTGEVGIGKTRLAEELTEWAGRQGIPSAHAACYAAEGNLPYAPIVTWLRSRPLPALPAPWRREVTRLLPGGTDHRGEPCEPWERLRLFEALAHAVFAWGLPAGKALRGRRPGWQSAAGPFPILLVLDDLQWCDRDTLDWLHFLLRFDSHSRLLVAGTARSGEMATDGPLAPLLDSLRRRGMVTEIELAPLNREETLALASQVVGRPLEPVLAEPLHRGSQGNPLSVVEMVRSGWEQKQFH
jgi:DNA-binding SARP family transcriptional activator